MSMFSQIWQDSKYESKKSLVPFLIIGNCDRLHKIKRTPNFKKVNKIRCFLCQQIRRLLKKALLWSFCRITRPDWVSQAFRRWCPSVSSGTRPPATVPSSTYGRRPFRTLRLRSRFPRTLCWQRHSPGHRRKIGDGSGRAGSAGHPRRRWTLFGSYDYQQYALEEQSHETPRRAHDAPAQ